MKPFIELVRNIIDTGVRRSDRTGVGRCSIFGTQTRFNLRDGFPLVTTRKIPYKAMIKETLWFASGSNDNQVLNDQGVHIWDEWVVKENHIDDFIKKHIPPDSDMLDGVETLKKHLMENYTNTIGPMYGYLWRNAPVTAINNFTPKRPLDEIASDKLKLYQEEYDELKFFNQTTKEPLMSFEDYASSRSYQSIDQLQDLINNLKQRPNSARLLVTSLVPEFVPIEKLSPQENILLGRGCLAPCHVLQQYFVLPPDELSNGKPRLCLLMFQRSVDTMIGSNFNISQYALLLSMIAQVVDMEPYEFIYSTGDTHLYLNHIEKAEEQIRREPYPLGKLKLNPDVKDLFKFTLDDIEIVDYISHPPIKYDIAV